MVGVDLILQMVGTPSLREVKWLHKEEHKREPRLPDSEAMSFPLHGHS